MKFSSWRAGQDKIFWDILDSKKRFSIHNAPVGCGKSPAYMTAALAYGKRVAILTESKGLMDQINSDFSSIGMFDMRGSQNYTCRALIEGGQYDDMWIKKWGKPTCDIGPCTAGLRCDLKEQGCDYFDDYKRACSRQVVSTNYAYWIAIHKYGQGLGKFDLLILDEAHAAADSLSAAMSVEFDSRDFKELKSVHPKVSAPLMNWRMWGRVQLQRVQGKLDFYSCGAKIGDVTSDGAATFVRDTDLPDAAELKFWKRLEGKCATLAESTDDWIVEKDEISGNVRIAPAFIRSYAENLLFLKIPRVVLMSATIRPKTADLLGLEPESFDFFEYPSTFPVERRPIYWIPTVRLNYSSTENDLRTWAVRIDQILARRLDRKGIIHTVSYERSRYLLENSRFRSIMHAHVSGNIRDVIQSFRNAQAPAVLVSPSVSTGFDFAYDQARFQIIGKLPFRDNRGAILTAQSKEDPDYLFYLTAQDLVQTYGRAVRADDDFAECFIVDDNVSWFIERYSHFFPKYFLDAFKPIGGVQDPPKLKDIVV